MSRIVILGRSAYLWDTAARYLNKWVGKKHEIVVVLPIGGQSSMGYLPTFGLGVFDPSK